MRNSILPALLPSCRHRHMSSPAPPVGPHGPPAQCAPLLISMDPTAQCACSTRSALASNAPALTACAGLIWKRQYGDMANLSWLREAGKEVQQQQADMVAAASSTGKADGAAVQVQAYQVHCAALRVLGPSACTAPYACCDAAAWR